MIPEAFEQHTRDKARHFAFIRNVVTLDRTASTIKLRLFITSDCFVQVYANLHKDLLNYALVLCQTRIYGRDNDGKGWHRHPTLLRKPAISATKAPDPFHWPSFSTRCNRF